MADLKISTVQTKAAAVKTPLLVLFFFEGDTDLESSAADLDKKLNGLLKRVVAQDFHGKKDETLVLYPGDGLIEADRVVLIGVGKREDFTLERLRRGVGVAVRQAEKLGVTSLALVLDHSQKSSERMGAETSARGAVDGAVLAAWDFKEYKSRKPGDPASKTVSQVTLIARNAAEVKAFEKAAGPAAIIANSTNLTRELQFRPGNEVTPSYLARKAQELGKKHDLKVTVLDREQMKKEGMRALLAVAQGSIEEPRFIVLEYMKGVKNKPPLVLIGKGVTFDTGGISIKPAERMEDMKYDMSGAAAVLGALKGIAELKLKANVIGLIPSTDNMPSGSAYKPGDVIRAHSGKTIEIVNTDAEGRLILADALSYAQRYKPAAVVDAATLTGAVVVALGQVAIGIMGNDGDLIDEVRAAGQRVGERCWPLPLWDEYRELIDSNIADMKNSGGRAAGSITGGWFLKEFAGDMPWVHLDIAGTAYKDDAAPYLRKGATGVPTRLFIEWVRTRAQK
jgi:leucyl aminopeptidase